eukprot:13677090-Alexandrium_andersonii.AAC.1
MSASLVGSEMCIRDRMRCGPPQWKHLNSDLPLPLGSFPLPLPLSWPCLLYTSDAADDMQ